MKMTIILHLARKGAELDVQGLDGRLQPLHLGDYSRHRHHDLDHALLKTGVDAHRDRLQLRRHARQVSVQAVWCRGVKVILRIRDSCNISNFRR